MSTVVRRIDAGLVAERPRGTPRRASLAAHGPLLDELATLGDLPPSGSTGAPHVPGAGGRRRVPASRERELVGCGDDPGVTPGRRACRRRGRAGRAGRRPRAAAGSPGTGAGTGSSACTGPGCRPRRSRRAARTAGARRCCRSCRPAAAFSTNSTSTGRELAQMRAAQEAARDEQAEDPVDRTRPSRRRPNAGEDRGPSAGRPSRCPGSAGDRRTPGAAAPARSPTSRRVTMGRA